MTNWQYGIFYTANAAAGTVSSGDFLQNGTQTVTTPYVGGTNINLNSGMNF
jgi:hypothetical protein